MFNMFEEHLFVCQSFLKERRRPPTGGLREALRSYWREGGGGGGGFSCPHPLEWVEKTLEPLQLDFPLLGENDGYCLGWNDPHWGGSCRSP